jgi:hypothetical protein
MNGRDEGTSFSLSQRDVLNVRNELRLGSSVCLFNVPHVTPYYPLKLYEVLVDDELVYSGYYGKKAFRLLLSMAKQGKQCLECYVDGDRRFFSRKIEE